MIYQTIAIEIDARGVATVTLNLPEKHNAMSALMISELSLAARKLRTDNEVRVVVLTGAGESFCAGGDLGWMKAQFNASRDGRMMEARRLAHMLKYLNELPKPLIGKVQGQAFGGGLGLMSICDVAIGVDTAKFALTETRLGLIPATIGPYVIARMGEGNARRVFMSGRRFDAEEAKAFGLLSGISSQDKLDAAVEAEIEPYLSTAPGAVAAAKMLARKLSPAIDDSVIEATVHKLADQWESPEAQEGISAFFEKRKPDWAT